MATWKPEFAISQLWATFTGLDILKETRDPINYEEQYQSVVSLGQDADETPGTPLYAPCIHSSWLISSSSSKTWRPELLMVEWGTARL